jgi:hypothetical protein
VSDTSQNFPKGSINDPHTNGPQQDGGADSGVTEPTQHDKCASKRRDAGGDYCCIVCNMIRKPFCWLVTGIRCTKSEHWIAIGTWALVLATIYIVLSAEGVSHRQLSAYLYINPGPAFHIDGQGILQVYSQLGNSGQTPATNVERFVGMEVAEITNDITKIGQSVREEGITILGPRSEVSIIKNWRGGAVSAEQFQKIRYDNKLRIYVFGTILYDDVFDGRWQINFCNAYFGSEGVNVSQPSPTNAGNTSFGYVGWQAKPCETGNEIKKRR